MLHTVPHRSMHARVRSAYFALETGAEPARRGTEPSAIIGQAIAARSF